LACFKTLGLLLAGAICSNNNYCLKQVKTQACESEQIHEYAQVMKVKHFMNDKIK